LKVINDLNNSMRLHLLLIAGLLFFASCVPNKKILLMQKDDVNKKDMPKDTILRTYALDTFQYKIQPYDLLSVRFQSLSSQEQDFFSLQNQQGVNQFQLGSQLAGELVDENGEIPIPVLGKFKIAGLTIFEAQDTLQAIAGRYTESPVVKVRLMNYRITVLGEVNREGTVTLSNGRVNMLEAIAQAGGFNDLSDRANVKLIRQRGATTEVQYINLLEEKFFNSPNYYVYQNDILIVPPLKQRAFRKYFGTNMSLFFSSVSFILVILSLNR
jgi:polysaccharide biosynthesis/export protein